MKTHLHSKLCLFLLTIMALAAIAANQALCANYKAIDLNPSGYSSSYAQIYSLSRA